MKLRNDSGTLTSAFLSRLVIFLAALVAPLTVAHFALAQNTEQLNGDAVIRHLNSVIGWYRHAVTGQPRVGLPSDVIYQQDAKSFAIQAVKLAFDSARAEASLLSPPKGSNDHLAISQDQQGSPSTHQRLARTQSAVTSKIKDLQTQISSLDKQIVSGPKRNLADRRAQRDHLQDQLELAKAIQDSLNKISTFVDVNGQNSREGLQGTINQLAASVPEIFGSTATQKPGTVAPPPASDSAQNGTSEGLYGQALLLYDNMRGTHDLNQLISETDRMTESAKQVRRPLVAQLGEAFKIISGNQQANAASGSAASGSASAPPDQDLDALTSKFKQISAATVPLSEEIIVLDQSRANFVEWRSSIQAQDKYLLRAILVRAGTILFVLLILLALSEVWRRFTFRYIHDARRRRQLLLLRRFIIGFLMGIVIIMGFISQFSSLATFAGLITAGIAVGLQTVILSIAAYFLLIGRWGIRVGDRISVAGVTGDVIDTGMVRFYLMELTGTGVDLYPTGRIVLFSNSVLFQAATPLYKQIPGSEYTWHEIAIELTPDSNHKLSQDKITKIVSEIYERYREEIERQHGNIERRIEVQLTAPNLETRLQFTDKGLELLVRYPVAIRGSAWIDEEITRKLLELINKDPELKKAVSGNPRIRPVA